MLNAAKNLFITFLIALIAFVAGTNFGAYTEMKEQWDREEAVAELEPHDLVLMPWTK